MSKQLRRGAARFLAGYRRQWLLDENLLESVLAAAALGSPIIDVERSLSESPSILVRSVVLHLLWTGELIADMSEPLDGLSVVKRRVVEREKLR